jgi:CO/xanthine dehydrogenase FAD-binding subunit
MSQSGITEYLRPATLHEAWAYISGGDPKVKLLSGGADLTINAPPEVTTLVDIGRVLDRAIHTGTDGAVHIGAGATLAEVLEHPSLAGYASGVVPEMMVHVGSPLLRNFSTIGGHLARGRLSDVVPVLIALDAQVTAYRNRSTIELSLAEYLAGRHNERPHILTFVRLPALDDPVAAAYLRIARTSFDFPILNCCCRVDGSADAVAGVHIVCGATPRVAERANQAEAIIREHGLNPSSIAEAGRVAGEEVPTGSGWVASADYRSHLVEVLVGRCLTTVMERLPI